MGNVSNRELMKRIDDEDGVKMLQAVDQLFANYDSDKSGVLEGQEFNKLLDDLTLYFYEKCEAKEPGTHSRREIWNWLKRWLDTNADDRCERHELEANLKKLMDAND
uniref:EF-hand domain-containing protein n=1 Tax=Noctiluca scintillans TaxID=2966 RepID=A0A7S1FBS7_NOCSC